MKRRGVRVAQGLSAVVAIFYGVLFIWLSTNWGFSAGILGGVLLTSLGLWAGVKAVRRT